MHTASNVGVLLVDANQHLGSLVDHALVDNADHVIIVRVVTNAFHRPSAGDMHTASNVGVLFVDANQHLGSLVGHTLVDDVDLSCWLYLLYV